MQFATRPLVTPLRMGSRDERQIFGFLDKFLNYFSFIPLVEVRNQSSRLFALTVMSQIVTL